MSAIESTNDTELVFASRNGDKDALCLLLEKN